MQIFSEVVVSEVTRAVYYTSILKSTFALIPSLPAKLFSLLLETILNKAVLKQIPKHNCCLTACCLSKVKQHIFLYLPFHLSTQSQVK